MAIVYEGFGNVLTHKAQSLVCPVNVVGVMGAGLARAFRNRIPGLNGAYKHMCEEGILTLGKVTTYHIEGTHQQVLLFPTKGHWKDDSEVSYIEEGLQYLVKHYKELGITEIAMPPIGCGLGKLDYMEDVRPLIEQYLGPLEDLSVYLLLRPAT